MSSDEFEIPQTILRHFDLTSIPYDEQFIRTTKTRRESYPSNKLFFDQLLAFADLDGSTLYPPQSPADLRRLLYAIHTSSLDRLKQDCYYYYLLRDYDAAQALPQANGHGPADGMDLDGLTERTANHVKDTRRAETFARCRCLPVVWRNLINGYWSLDNSQWEIAVKSLSDPGISDVNFVPEIILCLATQVSPPSQSLKLIRIILTFNPRQLQGLQDNDIKLLSFASAGTLSEAFNFIRDREIPEERVRMREVVWCWALGAPRTPCGKGEHGAQARTLKEMLHLPLTDEEHAHLIYFLSHPPKTISPPALSLLHDLVTLRLVHQGQYAESLQLDRQSAGSAGTDIDRQRRREMVREFISILPEVQRRALAVEGVERTEQHAVENAGLANGFVPPEEIQAADDQSMADSWINFDGPVTSTAQQDQPSTSRLHPPDLSRAGSPGPSGTPRCPQSPFTGPPRFASSHLASPAPVQRVLSGSPFALPRSRSVSRAGSPAPKIPKQIINDDDEALQIQMQRSRAALLASQLRSKRDGSAASPLAQASQLPEVQPQEVDTAIARVKSRDFATSAEHEDQEQADEGPVAEPEPPAEPTPKRKKPRTRKKVPGFESESQVEPAPEPAAAPESERVATPPPPSPPSHRTRSHPTSSSPETLQTVRREEQAAAPKTRKSPRVKSRPSMPGAFEPEGPDSMIPDEPPTSETSEIDEPSLPNEPTIPEDEVVPTPARASRRTGRDRQSVEPTPTTSRITRSASRAKIDEDDPAPTKRTRRNVRESSVASNATTAMTMTTATNTETVGPARRSTRSKGKAVDRSTRTGSELRSPTPTAATRMRKGTFSPAEDAVPEEEPAALRRATSARRSTRRK